MLNVMTAIAATVLVCAAIPRTGATIPQPPVLPLRAEDEAEPTNRHGRRRAEKLKRQS